MRLLLIVEILVVFLCGCHCRTLLGGKCRFQGKYIYKLRFVAFTFKIVSGQVSPCVECREVAGVIMCPKLRTFSHKPPCLNSKCNSGKMKIKQKQLRKVICAWLSKIAARNPKNLILFLKVVSILAKKEHMSGKENPEDLANTIEITETDEPIEEVNPNDKKVVRELFKEYTKDDPIPKKIKHHKKKKNKNKKKKGGTKKHKKKILEDEHALEEIESTPNEAMILQDETNFVANDLTTNVPFSIDQPRNIEESYDLNQEEENHFISQDQFPTEIDGENDKPNKNKAINIQYIQTNADEFQDEDIFNSDVYDIDPPRNAPKVINLVTSKNPSEQFDRDITNSRYQ